MDSDITDHSDPANVNANDDMYVIGVDYGTLSGRAVVVRVSDGREVGSAVHTYTHGVMDRVLAVNGKPLPPDWALQDSEDYVDVLREAVPKAVSASGVAPAQVIGIATDFTACTVLPVLADGTPLSRTDQFRDRPHAYVKLWKHHAAQAHADRINALAAARGEAWLPRYGGRISSEWEFAKGLQLLEEDPEIYAATERWVEAADWIIWQLCGVETRNVCTAGYKGIYQDGAWPSTDFLGALNPGFAQFAVDKLEFPLSPLGGRAGSLTAQAAAWTGLPEGIAVAVGNVDAHVTGPAAKATLPGQMLAVMGTSTCHVMNGDRLAEVPGMCGVVADGIVVPVACDFLSLVGVRQVIKTVKNVNSLLHHPVQIHGVLPTFYDSRARICRDAIDAMKEHFGDRVMPPIRQATRLKEAPAQGKTIFEYAPESNAAEDYLRVVDLLVDGPAGQMKRAVGQ